MVAPQKGEVRGLLPFFAMRKGGIEGGSYSVSEVPHQREAQDSECAS